VDRRAYELNIPTIAAAIPTRENSADPNVPASLAFLVTDSDSVVVEALKQAEDGDDLVLRTFDSHGSHCKVPFLITPPIAGVAETDLLEENPVVVNQSQPTGFTALYTPYEIKTHRLNISRG
jgi:alpha-mannosidase